MTAVRAPRPKRVAALATAAELLKRDPQRWGADVERAAESARLIALVLAPLCHEDRSRVLRTVAVLLDMRIGVERA